MFDDEEMFTVEEILDKRVVNGKVEYYIKWAGYSHSDNTWEPEVNLECPKQILDYERMQSKNKKLKLNSIDHSAQVIDRKPVINHDSMNQIDEKIDCKPVINSSSTNQLVEGIERKPVISNSSIDQVAEKIENNVKPTINNDSNNQVTEEIDCKLAINNNSVNQVAEAIESNDKPVISDSSNNQVAEAVERSAFNENDVNGDNDGSTVETSKDEDGDSDDMHVKYDFGEREPEVIVGCTNAGGELFFLVKWKGVQMADLVPAKVANNKWPQIVIAFYQERLTFSSQIS